MLGGGMIVAALLACLIRGKSDSFLLRDAFRVSSRAKVLFLSAGMPMFSWPFKPPLLRLPSTSLHIRFAFSARISSNRSLHCCFASPYHE